ncbi:F-box protein 10 [Sarotherodon galilaeus]
MCYRQDNGNRPLGNTTNCNQTAANGEGAPVNTSAPSNSTYRGKPNLARETHRGTTHRQPGLEVGTTYVFRVRAVNAAGVVMASMASDPVTAKAVAGSQEVSCVVDEKSGDIVLSFESCQINEGSKFIWKKDYKEITDFSKGVVIKSEGTQ